jgi:hydrogenase-4 component B
MAVSGMIAGLFRRRPMVADRVAAGLLGLGAVVGLGGAMAAVASPAAHGLAWPWALPWGRFLVAVDGISAAFLFPTLLVPALAGIYGVGYWSQQAHPESAARVRVFLGLLAGAMTTLLVARDAVLFLMAFEAMTLSAFFLVTTEDGKPEVREAGWVYLAASHASFITLLAMFSALHALTGSFDLTAVAPGSMGLGTRSVLFLLALVAFGVKAGVMPFHVWLPPAHASAPSHVSALMSGVLIKTGIYGIVRVLEMLPEPPVAWGVLLLLLGAASGIGGVAFAIAQHDVKRLLAYHSIENIGIIVMGIGLAVVGRATHAPLLVVLGLGAAVLHVWNHAIFKALLFLSAGVVVHATGTRDIDRMGGLGRALPWSSALFTLGAVAICGLPPLNGFVSELILYLGALESLKVPEVRLGALVAPVLAVIGALACACFVKVVGSVFLGMARDPTVRPGGEGAWSMRAPMLILASLCVVLGVVPVIAFPALDAAVASWMGQPGAGDLPHLREILPFPAIGIAVAVVGAVAAGLWWVLTRAARGGQIAGTWDCGYPRVTSRMQYTGSSFGRTLVDLLHPILRPHRHDPVLAGAFPERSAFRLHVGDVVFERWVLPLVERFADRCSRLRARQSHRIQVYIVYVVAATVGLLLFLIDMREILRAAAFK